MEAFPNIDQMGSPIEGIILGYTGYLYVVKHPLRTNRVRGFWSHKEVPLIYSRMNIYPNFRKPSWRILEANFLNCLGDVEGNPEP